MRGGDPPPLCILAWGVGDPLLLYIFLAGGFSIPFRPFRGDPPSLSILSGGILHPFASLRGGEGRSASPYCCIPPSFASVPGGGGLSSIPSQPCCGEGAVQAASHPCVGGPSTSQLFMVGGGRRGNPPRFAPLPGGEGARLLCTFSWRVEGRDPGALGTFAPRCSGPLCTPALGRGCVCCHFAFPHGGGGRNWLLCSLAWGRGGGGGLHLTSSHPREGGSFLFTSPWGINWARGCLCTHSQRRAGIITPWLGNWGGLRGALQPGVRLGTQRGQR